MRCAIGLLGLLFGAVISESGLRAQSLPAAKLVIGYEGEGHVDPSPRACARHLRDYTNWSKAQISSAIKEVCEARAAHKRNYDQFQDAYSDFLATFGDDKRLRINDAVKNIKWLARNCLDYKLSMTTGGHNIMMDIIPNRIAADCLAIASDLLRKETSEKKKFLAQANDQSLQVEEPKFQVGTILSGKIESYGCGDNCYLTIKYAGGREATGLCVARECQAWNDKAAIPKRLIGKVVSVRVGRGPQFDSAGNKRGEMMSFTRIQFLN